MFVAATSSVIVAALNCLPVCCLVTFVLWMGDVFRSDADLLQFTKELEKDLIRDLEIQGVKGIKEACVHVLMCALSSHAKRAAIGQPMYTCRWW